MQHTAWELCAEPRAGALLGSVCSLAGHLPGSHLPLPAALIFLSTVSMWPSAVFEGEDTVEEVHVA